jgi:hypothetical protein
VDLGLAGNLEEVWLHVSVPRPQKVCCFKGNQVCSEIVSFQTMLLCRSAAAITGGYAVAMVAGLSIMALQNLGAGVSVAVGLIVAVGVFVCGAVISYLTRSCPDQSVQEWFGVWSLAGTRNLRRTFQVCMRLTQAPFFALPQ